MRQQSHLCTSEIAVSLCVTTEITRHKDAQGFIKNKEAAQEGGEVAGSARKDAERRIGKTIISDENYLTLPEKKKKQLPKR